MFFFTCIIFSSYFGNDLFPNLGLYLSHSLLFSLNPSTAIPSLWNSLFPFLVINPSPFSGSLLVYPLLHPPRRSLTLLYPLFREPILSFSLRFLFFFFLRFSPPILNLLSSSVCIIFLSLLLAVSLSILPFSSLLTPSKFLFHILCCYPSSTFSWFLSRLSLNLLHLHGKISCHCGHLHHSFVCLSLSTSHICTQAVSPPRHSHEFCSDLSW